MRDLVFEPGCFYHIYNRGVDRQPIFITTANWGFFVRRMREHCQTSCADVVAYCLMPNHYHLVLQAHTTALGASVMQPLSISYTKAINKQEGRVGPLFQGPFCAKRIKDEDQLVQLSAYVHLNPVWAGLVTHPGDWVFSSYQDYAGLREGTLPKTEAVLCHFSSRTDYVQFVTEYAPNRAKVRDVLFQE